MCPPTICTIQTIAWKSNSNVWGPEDKGTLLGKWQSCRHRAHCRYPSHQCHMKNAFRTFPPAVPALCDWLIVPKVWLLAFGCFYLCVFGFAIHTPPPLTKNPTCHLWAINHVWGGETFGPIANRSGITWSGSSLVCFCPLLSVTLNKHLNKKRRSVSVQCTLMNDNDSDCIFSCCLKEKVEWTKVHVYFSSS